MEANKILEIINRLEFFDQFTNDEKSSVIALNAQFAIFKKDEKIISEGDRDSCLYVLLSGTVNVTKNESDAIIATLEAGEIFGEMSFTTHAIRATNITSNDSAITLKIDDALMNSLNVNVREKIKDKIINKLVARIVAMNDKIISHAF